MTALYVLSFYSSFSFSLALRKVLWKLAVTVETSVVVAVCGYGCGCVVVSCSFSLSSLGAPFSGYREPKLIKGSRDRERDETLLTRPPSAPLLLSLEGEQHTPASDL